MIVGSSKMIVFFLVFVVLCLPAVHSQEARVSISMSDTSAVAVINEIRNQVDIDFVYNHEELEKCPKVSVEISNGTVEEVLVVEGDTVEEGQVLARLDTSEWEAQLTLPDEKSEAADRQLTARERD